MVFVEGRVIPMVYGPRFPTDTNSALMAIQHESYWGLVGWLFECPRQRYKEVVRLLCVETELWNQIKDLESYDHRVLQNPHDKIAAHYRYTHPQESQLSLFETNHEKQLKENWQGYWYMEVRELTTDSNISRAILTAVGYQNTPKGFSAEEVLNALLDERYGTDWDTGSAV
jgi:hypothetical protein